VNGRIRRVAGLDPLGSAPAGDGESFLPAIAPRGGCVKIAGVSLQ